ncbi:MULTISPECIES: KAP family P-loop NTPase fold protein [Rhizobium]|uniref:KAP family P-loop NTPase fold protein n=2 Tax=Rhizobium/Agrobacterium group TaxID=227290 RepID=UPI001039C02F|nr:MULTISPECIES: P-loop NTPase fold protein [Rhizobium]MBY4587633.1 KAP family NTPase [Rhizobium redzepovicii]MBY4617271.1 KAP family NTPase [Rhizobium redzepovicii]MDF0659017.1 P-loop NTPase fold protein [Rhizobium sp. BC49]TBY44705.1 hypothetical protein E0H54_24625 [Rhizobium leguminosarum bv. viciae]
MIGRLFGDRPISRPEDDAFGLSSFADALATSLLQMSPRDGLVVSVEGPWGAGKSSAIALAMRTVMLRVLAAIGEGREEMEGLSDADLQARWIKLAKRRQTHIVKFNPWSFSGQENLVRAFFSELSSQLQLESESWWSRQMNRIAGYLPSFGGTVATGSALAAGASLWGIAAAAGAIGRALGEIGQKAFSKDASLELAKKKLAGALRTSEQRVIVVIDDLDRLMPSEMRAVFSLVKSLGDLPNVLYVLSFDDAIVHKALHQTAEKIEPDFLEKIVQVSLKLPPPWRSELHQLLYERLNAIIGDASPADENRWRRMMTGVIDPYLETPRDVTRLVNSIQVIWPNVQGDVDLTDLIGITTLQLFDPKVYDLIRNEIETITYADYNDEDDDDLGKRLEPAMAENPEAAKVAMTILFPRLSKAWKTFSGDSTVYLLQKEQRRISTKEYHRNYFVFGRDPRMMTRSEIDGLLTAPNPSKTLDAAIRRLESDTSGPPSRIATMLGQFIEVVYARPLLTPAFVRALLDNADHLIRREDEVWDMVVTHNDERLSNIITLGLEKLDAEVRTEILGILVEYESGLQTRTTVVEADGRRHGLFGNEPAHETERLFSAENIEAAALAIRAQVAAACDSDLIWTMPKPGRLIWAWKRMTDNATVRAWTDAVIEHGEHVADLANSLPSRSYRTDSDGSKVVWIFQREHYADILDTDALLDRLTGLAAKNAKASEALDRLREAEARSRD